MTLINSPILRIQSISTLHAPLFNIGIMSFHPLLKVYRIRYNFYIQSFLRSCLDCAQILKSRTTSSIRIGIFSKLSLLVASSCHLYHCLSLEYCGDLISELMVSHLHGSMVSTHDGSADAEAAQPGGHSSPPPTLAQVIASIRESRMNKPSCCVSL
jgi:hypothetical protein